jgi:hypothetical protein
MDDLIKRDDALNACALREDNPPTEMQLSLRNVISALPAIDPTDRIEQTEAKLTKAVEALKAAQQYVDELEWHYGGPETALGKQYYATLAELEGK